MKKMILEEEIKDIEGIEGIERDKKLNSVWLRKFKKIRIEFIVY